MHSRNADNVEGRWDDSVLIVTRSLDGDDDANQIKCDIKFQSLVVVTMQNDMLGSLTVFMAKVLAGVELTSLYLFSLGTAYPPIEEDVTFFCVKP